ncbi:MAG: hypothetical protein OHK0052_14500 [Anaerolineales bacterium]
MPESLEVIFNRMLQTITRAEIGEKRYNDVEMRLIERAFNFAHNAHEYKAKNKDANGNSIPQRRRNGDFYISHCAAVVEILVEKLPPASIRSVNTLIAALLHDVLEDTTVSAQEIEEEFGKEVVEMVASLTKFEVENKPFIKLLDEKDTSATEPISKNRIDSETLRKILLGSIKDPLVACIKLADRVHNMRTLQHMPPQKQKSIAEQTMNIYAPLANRMGLWPFKSELEDLAFRYLYPQEYKAIRDGLSHQTVQAQAELERLKHEISQQIVEEFGTSLPFQIEARQKHVYSIYRKMQRKNVPFDKVADILGLRIILGKYDPKEYTLEYQRLQEKMNIRRSELLLPANAPLPPEEMRKIHEQLRHEDQIIASDAPELAVERRVLQEKLRNLRRQIRENHEKLYRKEPYKSDCYKVLGIIHELFPNFIDGEIDDYIARPKANGYRSLHTAVNFIGIGQKVEKVEFQIRTAFMHYEAEYGADLAHWGYKEGVEIDETSLNHINTLRRALKEVVEDTDDATELVDITREQILSDQIFVITPKGDVFQLPQNSTPIDFAYAVHTELGHRCRGARVNDKLVALNTKLNNGDKVEIIPVRSGGPSRDWLNEDLEYVNSPRARSKIRQWFRAQERAKNIQEGRKILENEMQRLGVKITEINLSKLISAFKLRTSDELYHLIGCGDIGIARIINQIRLQGQQIVFDELRTTVLEEQHIQEVAKMLERQSLEELYFDLAIGAISSQTLRARFKELETRLVYETSTSKLPATAPPKYTVAPSKNREIEIIGLEGDFPYAFARCCKPVRGEPITGYLTRGRGITVHRSDCATILRMQTTPDAARLLQVNWSGGGTSRFYVPVYIEAYNRVGLMNEITNLAKDEGINLQSINSTQRRSDSIAIITAEFSVTDMNQLHRVLTRIKKLKNVTIAQRFRN